MRSVAPRVVSEFCPLPSSLDAIAANPSLVRTLAPETVGGLRRKLVVVLAALTEAEGQPFAPAPDRPEPLLDAKAAAAILDVPVTWLREAARQGRIRCVRLGHYVRFRRGDLEAFIEGDPTT
jgi:excisionase family DNA binding protein